MCRDSSAQGEKRNFYSERTSFPAAGRSAPESFSWGVMAAAAASADRRQSVVCIETEAEIWLGSADPAQICRSGSDEDVAPVNTAALQSSERHLKLLQPVRVHLCRCGFMQSRLQPRENVWLCAAAQLQTGSTIARPVAASWLSERGGGVPV